MPVLDGYRATHLIRHHKPYSSLPGIRAVPIVAMTASAIEGDREKCERAGMDDYLAKPVKGKTLERMLVKWALEGRNMGTRDRSDSDDSHLTDHDSNCPGSEIPPPSPTPSAKPVELFPPSIEGHTSNSDSSDNILPGVEIDSNRSMQKVEAEEKAMSLRDEKLFMTASARNHTTPPSLTSGPSRPSLQTTALTEENMGRLDREQDEAHTITQPFLPDQDSTLFSNSSIAVEGKSSSTGSTLGSLKSVGTGAGASKEGKQVAKRKGRLNRNDSDMSSRTVTQNTTAGES